MPEGGNGGVFQTEQNITKVRGCETIYSVLGLKAHRGWGLQMRKRVGTWDWSWGQHLVSSYGVYSYVCP